jgi:hypothetical protein
MTGGTLLRGKTIIKTVKKTRKTLERYIKCPNT